MRFHRGFLSSPAVILSGGWRQRTWRLVLAQLHVIIHYTHTPTHTPHRLKTLSLTRLSLIKSVCVDAKVSMWGWAEITLNPHPLHSTRRSSYLFIASSEPLSLKLHMHVWGTLHSFNACFRVIHLSIHYLYLFIFAVLWWGWRIYSAVIGQKAGFTVGRFPVCQREIRVKKELNLCKSLALLLGLTSWPEKE